MENPLIGAPHDPLPGPYQKARGDKVEPTAAVLDLVRGQVRAVLDASPAYRQMDAEQRREMAMNMVKIAAYSAALTQDAWSQAESLGQVPVLHTQTMVGPAEALAAEDEDPVLAGARAAPSVPARGRAAGPLLARSAAADPNSDEFSPRAASQVAQITQDTLNAIAFPTFVADLIKGTFQAIVDAAIQQMEAFGSLLANVAKTVDQFMADNITDNQARDYLTGSYPGHFRLDIQEDRGARVVVRRGADDLPTPSLKSDLGLSEDVDLSDEAAEEVLVPAARRHLAQSRQQLLATMVLMGINRIVVTRGTIKAKMGFRIDTSDRGRSESASQFDFKNETTASAGGFFFGWSARTKTTVAYVSSSKKESEDSIDVQADLTGEVDLRFKSETFPLERFAESSVIGAIQSNTPNPAANKPVTGNTAGEGGAGAAAP